MTEEASASTNHMDIDVDKLQLDNESSPPELANDKDTNNHTEESMAAAAAAVSGEKSKTTNDHVVSDSGDAEQMEDGDDGGSKEDGEQVDASKKVSNEDAESDAAPVEEEKDEEKGACEAAASLEEEDEEKKETKALKKVKKKSKKDESNEDSDENADDMIEVTRRRRRQEVDSSDTDSDVERPDGDEETDKKSEPELSSDFEDELLSKPLPKPKWHAIPQLRARELGTPRNRFDFCTGALGSVHLVSRFDKYCELKHHDGCVNTLHFNQSGSLLASGSDDLEVVLWDWAKKKPVLVYESGHRSNVFQAKFMPFSGDTTLVSCARDGQVRVAELSSTGVCKGTRKIVQHKQAAHKLGLEPDSPVEFLSCGEDAAVFGIDLRDTLRPNKLVTVKESDKKVALYTIFVNPVNTNEFAVGGRDHYVRVYDKRRISDDETNGIVKKFCPHHLVDSDIRANVTCCVYSHDGSELLASYNDEDIYIFDSSHSDGADAIHRYKGHRNNATVKGVNFYGPRSEFIVSGSDCGHIFLWEKESERIVQYMKGDVGGVINCLESHPSSAVLATSGLDHDVKVWMPTAKETSKLEGLKRTMFSNRREREEERRSEPDFIDNHMLMFLMHHLRRRALRQAREAGEIDAEDISPSDSEASDDDDDDDDGDLPREHVQCAPS
ncbi:DDB1- and CUL4-associated factor 8-like [Amphiura filiformis]|uniref:DDB1- and CUL4-associated factor 8-like n=1 Tax=Amphiura filiformis TaxID=82378 RepID=UPI003B214A51